MLDVDVVVAAVGRRGGPAGSEAERTNDSPRRRVSVVIPAMNEARNLPHVLSLLPTSVDEVVLVDGRSTDGTVHVARTLRPDVLIVDQVGRGKGNALTAGFAAASGDILVMLDADGSADPREIPRFLTAIEQGADVAKGSRFLPGGGSADITSLRRAGNYCLTALVNRLFRTHYSDLCYGYNALRANCVAQLDIRCDGFEVETLMNIRIAKAGLRVTEVASFEHPRLFGVSNLNAFRDGCRVLRTIVRERVATSRRSWPAKPELPRLEWLSGRDWTAGHEKGVINLRGLAVRDRKPGQAKAQTASGVAVQEAAR